MFGKLQETAHLTMSKLMVTELFSSIQGESTHAGALCTFIRLSGCNLRCTFCDTEYSYDGGNELSVDELVKFAKSENIPLVEITGGEPLLHSEVSELSSKLLQDGFTVLVETNGSLPISVLPKDVIKIVDVKTPGSGEGGSFNINNLDSLTKNDELKFVISDRDDFEWARDFIKTHNPIAKKLFSPCWERMKLEELADWIVSEKLDVKLGIQQHKVIWGTETRGV
jgi:7-carboxy-7-deazaguanine synthase